MIAALASAEAAVGYTGNQCIPMNSDNPFIRKLQRVETFNSDEISLLEEISAPARVMEARQDIVRQGERLHHSTLLLEGFVSRYKLLTDGSRQILSFQIPGDFVDLHSFLLKTMDHGISTLSRCKLVSVPHEALRKITEHYPRLTRALWWDVAVDGAIFREWMVGIGSRDSQQRIAHLICELLHRLGAIGRADKQGFALPLTQSDLGEAMGITPVHVNRVLRDLRKTNVVQFSKQRVEILDLKRLSQIADFDDGYLHL